MQREIKVRAWDNYNHRWLDLFGLRFSKDGSVIAVNTLDGESYGLHQVDIIEYTGLKDNTKWEQLTKTEQKAWLTQGKTKEEWDGKEIYEGDIVKLRYWIAATLDDKGNEIEKKYAPSHIVEVIYSPPMWQGIGCSETRVKSKLPWSDKALYPFAFTDHAEREVIGNIYENKDML